MSARKINLPSNPRLKSSKLSSLETFIRCMEDNDDDPDSPYNRKETEINAEDDKDDDEEE